MSILSEIEADAEALLAKIKDNTIVETAVGDAKAIESASVSYLKANGLQDIYQLALDFLPALLGQPWGTVVAKVGTEAVAMGKTLTEGEKALIASQAQADLIAAGKLLTPVTVAAPAA